MRQRLLILALFAPLAAATQATAATAELKPRTCTDGRYGEPITCWDWVLIYRGEGAEPNRVQVAVDPARLGFRISDSGATIHAGIHCLATGPHQATCPSPSRNVDSARIFGGPGDDALAVSGVTARLDGGAGRDRLTGGASDDELRGGPGIDVLDGGRGQDLARYDEEGRPVIVDLRRGRGGTRDGREALTGIEGAFGGRGDDRLTGDRGANRLGGNEGNDVLRGGAGADELAGGRGFDLMDAGPGNDRIYAAEDRHAFINAEAPRCGAGRDILNASDPTDTPRADCELAAVSPSSIDYPRFGLTPVATLAPVEVTGTHASFRFFCAGPCRLGEPLSDLRLYSAGCRGRRRAVPRGCHLIGRGSHPPARHGDRLVMSVALARRASATLVRRSALPVEVRWGHPLAKPVSYTTILRLP